MFLHSGASLHGHEYSGRQSVSSPQPAPQNLRYPILWSPFSSAKPRITATVEDAPPAAAPVLQESKLVVSENNSLRTPPEPVVRFREPAKEEDIRSVRIEDVPSESEFNEPMMSVMTPPHRSRRRVAHKHTTYFLGYPTPKILGRKKVMQKVLPRLLLQLQKVSDDGRSRPVLEIFPSSRIAGPVIAPRLAKRFPGIFGVKRQLGYDDLVLVRRDDDDSTSDSIESDEEHLEKGKLVAIYSPLKHSDAAEIVLDDGAVWTARPLPNGSYDFVHEDCQGNVTTVRWAKRAIPPNSSRTQASPDTTTSVTDVSQLRYTFSVINPLSRRHPVLASLTQTTLDVQDTYTTITPFSGRHPRIRPASRSMSMNSAASQYFSTANSSPKTPAIEQTLNWGTDEESENEAVSPLVEPESKRILNTVDAATKNLISVTALWVALRSGWSPNYTPSHHADNHGTAASTGGRSRRNTWSRATVSENCGRSTPQLSETEVCQFTCSSKRNSMPAQLPAGLEGPPPPSRTPTPVSVSISASSSNSRILPRRATSTGATFMNHRISNQQSSSETNNEQPPPVTANRKTIDIPPPQLLGPPPVSHNQVNAHILSPIPATPASRLNSLSPLQDGPFSVDGYSSVPRAISVSGAGARASRVMRPEECSAGSGQHKGGLRSKLSRWVHKFGTR